MTAGRANGVGNERGAPEFRPADAKREESRKKKAANGNGRAGRKPGAAVVIER